jgi:hypothetical protein
VLFEHPLAREAMSLDKLARESFEPRVREDLRTAMSDKAATSAESRPVPLRESDIRETV